MHYQNEPFSGTKNVIDVQEVNFTDVIHRSPGRISQPINNGGKLKLTQDNFNKML